MHISILALLSSLATLTSAAPAKATGPFFTELGNSTWIFGNEVWNVTQGLRYGTKLNYKGRDLVGKAVGHYVSYSKSTESMDP